MMIVVIHHLIHQEEVKNPFRKRCNHHLDRNDDEHYSLLLELS